MLASLRPTLSREPRHGCQGVPSAERVTRCTPRSSTGASPWTFSSSLVSVKVASLACWPSEPRSVRSR
jgi:hypothetical protein